MKINIHDLLPEKLSDESAYHLVNFFMDLATALESCYFAQMHRYINHDKPNSPEDYISHLNEELPF